MIVCYAVYECVVDVYSRNIGTLSVSGETEVVSLVCQLATKRPKVLQ